jgi:hypothetical protein
MAGSVSTSCLPLDSLVGHWETELVAIEFREGVMSEDQSFAQAQTALIAALRDQGITNLDELVRRTITEFSSAGSKTPTPQPEDIFCRDWRCFCRIPTPPDHYE